jgi:hypothetical protein
MNIHNLHFMKKVFLLLLTGASIHFADKRADAKSKRTEVNAARTETY